MTSIAGSLEVLSRTLIVEAPHLTISILEAFVRQIITNRRRCYIVAHITGWLWSRSEGRCSSEVVVCAYGTGATVLTAQGQLPPKQLGRVALEPPNLIQAQYSLILVFGSRIGVPCYARSHLGLPSYQVSHNMSGIWFRYCYRNQSPPAAENGNRDGRHDLAPFCETA